MGSNLTPMQVQSIRTSLYSNGFRPVPVYSNDKAPYGKAWQLTAKNCTSKQAHEWPSPETLNTGILCDGLRAVDIDCDDPAQSKRIASIAWELLGPAPVRERTNSARRLLLYRAESGIPRKRAVGKVEILGQGQQFVAYGKHPSGSDYVWVYGDPVHTQTSALTVVSEDQIKLFLDSIRGEFESADGASINIPHPGASPATERECSYAQKALADEVSKLSALKTGSARNNACNVAAHSLGTMVGAGWIDAATVAGSLLDAMVANGWVAKRSLEAAKATIVSGLSRGSEKPRQPLTEGDLGIIDPSTLMVGGKLATAILAEPKAPKAKTSKPSMALVPPHARNVVLRGLSDVQEEAVQWLWNGYLPEGMLTLLSGAGGTGKSTLAFGFAATITTGGLWPDGQRCVNYGNVLIWSSEDDVARTIKPRLMAANADITKIATIESTTDDEGNKLPFDPARDIDSLRASVERIGGVSLLIIDPIVSAVSGDMHKANDVRRSLQPIVDFAAEFNCAVLGITHFAKNTSGRNASERVIGSQAFAALARMVLVTAKEEDSDQRVFTRAKSNISADDGGINYTIQQVSVQGSGGIALLTTRVAWGGPIQGTARSILSSVEGEETEHSGKKMDEAKNFLYNLLAKGPLAVSQVKLLARNAGIASVTLQRAKEAMSIQSVKRKGEFVDGWDWMLPMQQIAAPIELLRG